MLGAQSISMPIDQQIFTTLILQHFSDWLIDVFKVIKSQNYAECLQVHFSILVLIDCTPHTSHDRLNK